MAIVALSDSSGTAEKSPFAAQVEAAGVEVGPGPDLGAAGFEFEPDFEFDFEPGYESGFGPKAETEAEADAPRQGSTLSFAPLPQFP